MQKDQYIDLFLKTIHYATLSIENAEFNKFNTKITKFQQSRMTYNSDPLLTSDNYVIHSIDFIFDIFCKIYFKSDIETNGIDMTEKDKKLRFEKEIFFENFFYQILGAENIFLRGTHLR